jgi:tRNA A37 threonylcarbamoyladenosine dehydratase
MGHPFPAHFRLADTTIPPHFAAMSPEYLARFAGIGRLYGRTGLERLAAARVVVVGLGGVGSWAVEALARSGVGTLALVDMDDVCVSNTNRQIQALEGNGGRPKAEVLRERVLAINPECRVLAIPRFFTASTVAEILAPAAFAAAPPDAVVDAIDSLRDKCLLLAECRDRAIPVVSSGGCAGKRDGTAVRISDLSRSGADNLLRLVRRKLRREYSFPRAGKPFGIPCVWSEELAAEAPAADCAALPGAGTGELEALSKEPNSRGELEALPTMRPNCEWGYGTAVFVSGAFGFAAASVVVSRIAQDAEPK